MRAVVCWLRGKGELRGRHSAWWRAYQKGTLSETDVRHLLLCPETSGECYRLRCPVYKQKPPAGNWSLPVGWPVGDRRLGNVAFVCRRESVAHGPHSRMPARPAHPWDTPHPLPWTPVATFITESNWFSCSFLTSNLMLKTSLLWLRLLSTMILIPFQSQAFLQHLWWTLLASPSPWRPCTCFLYPNSWDLDS